MTEIAQLDQSLWYKGKRHFVLQDDGILRVASADTGRQVEFSINIAQLNPQPSHEKRRSTSLLVGMVLFALPVTSFLVCGVVNHDIKESLYACMAVSGFFCFPFLLCMYSYLKQSYDIVIFHGYTGGKVVFLNKIPSPEALASFLDRLSSEIAIHRDKLPSFPKSLSQELEALVKLRENGVLSEAEFNTTKQNLINVGKSPVPVGF